MELTAAHGAAALGGQLGFDSGDLLWALGQVVSRSFGDDQGGEVALLPGIDLCNHNRDAGRVEG
jgi:hypothetical protein